MARVYNYKKDKPDERDYKFKSFDNYVKLSAARPSVVDWTKVMSPVKNQGQLGSCVGFGVTAMKEYEEVAERIYTQKEYGPTTPELSDLSEAYLYWNAKEYDPDKGEGTSIRYAMMVLQKKGVPTEKFWPYSDSKTGQALPGSEEAAAWTKIGSYWRLSTLEDILTALSTQPVPIGIECFSEFDNIGRDGIVPLPGPNSKSMGGHCICLVGYDDTKRLLKFKNSWGTGWGQNGYGYISYDYFRHIIDSWTCTDLMITDGTIPVTPSPVTPNDDKKDSKSKLPLFIGIGAGALVLLGIVIFFLSR
jgi:C1A family cysteine protease